MLSVQELLEERFPDFTNRHTRTARTLIRFLGYLFYESRFQQFGNDYPHLKGFDFVEETLRYFDFTLRLRENERERIPAAGRVVIAANHPIGSLDGLALLKLVHDVRPDVKVVANELLSAVQPLQPLLLPVNNMGGNTARTNLKNIREHLEADGALIIFPAGEVSRISPMGVRDGKWLSGFVKIASATRAPIQPIYVAGRNSLFFYSLSFLAKPLSTAWLIREMFKQSHNTVDARVGNPISYEAYSAHKLPAKKLAKLFRKQVYALSGKGRKIFQSIETVAHPENRVLLKQELKQAELLGETPDGKRILLVQAEHSDCVMREIGRLREMTFRTVGEGCGLPRDIDRYDQYYQQLVLWDPEQLEIAGAYRLGDASKLVTSQGQGALYTHSLYRFGGGMQGVLSQGLELGRSFVQPRYQDRHSLDYLWLGIGAYLRRYPRYRYLFGPASISPIYGRRLTSMIAWFYSHYHDGEKLQVEGRDPFEIDPEYRKTILEHFDGSDRKADFKTLRNKLAEQGLPVPPLYKHYSEVAEPEGVQFAAFNVDPSFGDCVDGLVVVDLEHLKPRKRKRYLGQEGTDHGSTKEEPGVIL